MIGQNRDGDISGGVTKQQKFKIFNSAQLKIPSIDKRTMSCIRMTVQATGNAKQ